MTKLLVGVIKIYSIKIVTNHVDVVVAETEEVKQVFIAS